MSRENVEIVRRAIEAFNRGDLDAAGDDFHPEAEVDWSRSPGVEAGIYRGEQAIRRFWSTFGETFERVIFSPDEFIECGDHVVVPNRTCFWGRDGIRVEAHSVPLVTVRHGLIVEWRLYRERGEALKALGLE